MNSFDKSWETKIYSQGRHINRYPYGEIVSIFFNSLKYLETGIKEKSEIKVLELGSGAGNNLWFIAESGFQVFGIDGSHSVCDIAKKQLLDRGVDVSIQQALFEKLPFEDNSIDIIIDRESTYCGKIADIKSWWCEAQRVLKKGGIVISFMFNDENPDLKKIKRGLLNAQKVEKNTYVDVEKGTFFDTGIVHFTSYEELFEIFSFCDIKFINKHMSETIYDTVDSQFNYSEWIMVGVKK